VTMTEASQTFTMALPAKPELVNVDANKKTLWLKTDNKSAAEYAFQYAHAPLFVDRREAIDAAAKDQTIAANRATLLAALNDKFYNNRLAAVEALKLDDKAMAKAAAPALRKLAATEKEPWVQASLLGALAKLKDKKDEAYISKQLSSQSYNVQGAALRALATVQPTQALARAKTYEANAQGAVAQAVTEVYAKNGGQAQWAFVRDRFDAARSQGKFNMMEPLATITGRLDDAASITEGINRLQEIGVKYKAYGADRPIVNLLQGVAKAQAGRPQAATTQQAVEQAVAAVQAAK
jgi:aminopeptidase N